MGTNGISSGLINVDILPTPGNGGTGSATNVAPIKLINDEMEAEIKAKLTTAPTLDPNDLTLRTKGALLDSFRSACSGLNPSDAELEKIILKIANGKTIEDLLKVDESTITNYTKILKIGVQYAQKNPDGSISIDNIIQASLDWTNAINNGWSETDAATFFKGESIIKRLDRYYDIYDLNTEEGLNKAIIGYFKTKHEEDVKKIKLRKLSPEKEEAAIQKLVWEEKRDFAKLIANTHDPKQKAILQDALKYLCSENRLEGHKALFLSVQDDAIKQDMAKKASTMEYIKETFLSEDGFGRTMKEGQVMEAVATTESLLTYENSTESRVEIDTIVKEFEDKFADILKSIAEKEQREEPLTAEEQAVKKEKEILELIYGAKFTGTVQNSVMTETQKENATTEWHSDLYSHDSIYRGAITQINDYIKEKEKTGELNSDEVKEFTEMMNQATNGNYEIILKDIKNGTTSELNPPLEPKAETNTSSTNNTGLAIDVKEKVTESPLTEKQKQSLIESQNKEIKDAESKARKARRSGDESKAEGIMYTATVRAIKNYAVNGFTFSEIIENIGCTRNEGIVYAYENQNILSGKFIEGAKDTFKNLDVKEKANFIAKHDIKAYNFIASELTLEELKYFEAEKIGSSTLQAIISNRIETFDKNNIEE